MTRVGVLGAAGAVGSALLARLAGTGARLTAGVRDPGRLSGPPPGAAVRVVDAEDPAGLAEFCSSHDVVVNCAGPSALLGDRVLRAAAAAGAHYVSVGDDGRDHLSPAGPDDPDPAPGRCALLGAGLLPGLSTLLPRVLADGFDRVTDMTVHSGGLERFTPAAARDYVAGLASGADRSLAAWRGGRRVAGALRPEADARLPFLPRPVSLHPFLSPEAERLARALSLERLDWWHVFEGTRTTDALAGTRGRGVTDPDALADLLVRASGLEVFGRTQYQALVLRAGGRIGGRERTRVLALTGAGPALSAEAAALAVRFAAGGGAADGTHWAGEALPTAGVLDGLRDAPGVAFLRLTDDDDAHSGVEEGVL
ncbi:MULTISPECIES: NAD(P)H-binding protein [Nocardiopsis]|uniref:NAD(P)H-binding protein n=1 Tax=Nocardiopsis TaxID=2013 RepID=UPI0008FCCE3D|nr:MULTISPECIES: NAD(P)H-binding protein [Nocardiopsis]APC35421.1 NAD-dependent dehydratase [Nocardiopsis dassonvillei]